MNKLLPHFVKLLFGVFILGVVAAVMFYSFQGLGLIFKNDFTGQLFGMMLFDVASIVWFFVFISACASTMQYIFSGIGFLLGIAGTLGLVGIEVGLSSGMLEAGTMQRPLTYIFIAALIGHLVLIYAHHASEPNVAAKISLGVDKASITDQAQKEATKILTENMPQLSAPIAARLVQEVMKDLNLQPQRGTVLDLPALPVVDTTSVNDSATKLGVMDFLRGLWQGKKEEPRTYEKTAAVTGLGVEAAKKRQEAFKAKHGDAPTYGPVKTDSLDGQLEKETTYHPKMRMTEAEEEKRVVPKVRKYALAPERERALNTPDGAPGHTVGDVVKSGLCSCPPIVFDESRDQPFSDDVQKVLGEKTKGRGIACLRETGQQETWLDESLCHGCPFYEGATVVEDAPFREEENIK